MTPRKRCNSLWVIGVSNLPWWRRVSVASGGRGESLHSNEMWNMNKGRPLAIDRVRHSVRHKKETTERWSEFGHCVLHEWTLQWSECGATQVECFFEKEKSNLESFPSQKDVLKLRTTMCGCAGGIARSHHRSHAGGHNTHYSKRQEHDNKHRSTTWAVVCERKRSLWR